MNILRWVENLFEKRFLAILFLAYYEIHWVKNLQRTNYGRARKYNKNFRFIDDLGTINDGGQFERSHNEIYPEELLLNKENEVDTNAPFGY